MRYIIGSLIAVGLVIIIIILIFTGRNGGSIGPQPIDLTSLANTGTTVQLVTEGELSANETRREIRVTVGRDASTLKVIKGYQGHVISSHKIDNNRQAYAAFLHGLKLAGFNLGNTAGNQDERGYCPLGRRYIYKVIDAGGHVTQKFWSDTCDSDDGTFRGNSDLVRRLFELQIPKYDEWTEDVDLG